MKEALGIGRDLRDKLDRLKHYNMSLNYCAGTISRWEWTTYLPASKLGKYWSRKFPQLKLGTDQGRRKALVLNKAIWVALDKRRGLYEDRFNEFKGPPKDADADAIVIPLSPLPIRTNKSGTKYLEEPILTPEENEKRRATFKAQRKEMLSQKKAAMKEPPATDEREADEREKERQQRMP